MRFILFLIVFIIYSCSAPNTTQPTKEEPKFMSKAEIFAEIKMLNSSKSTQTQEHYTQADMVRLNSLIDNKVFVGQHIKDKKTKKIIFKGQAEVDLRHRDTPIKAQDNGKCTAFAGIAAIENTINRDKKVAGLDLSEWDAWSHYGQYSCEAFMKASTKTKICDEKYYPQYGRQSAECEKNAYASISSQVYLDDDVMAMTKALDLGNVVYIGMSTPSDMVKCKKVISPKTSVTNGGHALVLVGYYKENGEVIGIIRNSWGSDCGDSGYQYMPLSLCNRRDMYCIAWEIRGVSTDRTPEPFEPQCKIWKRVWYKPWVRTCTEWLS